VSCIPFAAVIALLAFTGSLSTAEAGPWCSVEQSGAGDGATNCGFVTWEQCMETALSNRGYCAPNPADPPRASRTERRPRKAYRERY
jgi:hypothetical protein